MKEGISANISKVTIQEEFRICPEGGYERGFHVSFLKEDGEDAVRSILICPNCGARFELEGLQIATG
jgi:hypothetical protein